MDLYITIKGVRSVIGNLQEKEFTHMYTSIAEAYD